MTEIPTEHPHIVRKPGTCGGSPIIRGTRIAVRHIAFLWNEGETVNDIVLSYPHLQVSWVHDAISYYLDHRSEVDRELEENETVFQRLRTGSSSLIRPTTSRPGT